MRTSTLFCLVGVVSSAAPGAYAENLMNLLQKKLGPDPLATICASAPCRKNVKIALKKDDGSDFKKTLKLAPPVVYNQSVTIFPGETIRLETGEGPDGFKDLKAVSKVEHPERTITIIFGQERKPGAKPVMALTIANPFGAPLSYAALIAQGEQPAISGADTCPAAVQAASRQEWPGLVTEVLVSNFKLLDPAETAACRNG